MEVVFILIIVFGIIIYSVIRAFGAVVGAGGNLPEIISEIKKVDGNTEQNDNRIEDDNDMINNPASQTWRTIAGILFSVLLVYPFAIYNDKPAIQINPRWQLIIFALLIIIEIILFLIIRKIDHNYHQHIVDTSNDDNKTPKA